MAGTPATGGRLTTLLAPAKLTTSLRITGVRDDGHHLIDAEMVSLDLADELTFSDGHGLVIVREAAREAGTAVAPSAGKGAEVPTGGEGDAEVPVGGATAAEVPAGEENLISRALRAVGRDAHVRVVKRVPAGGGLGGGSSDAAAVLRWAGCNDLTVATSLGADVPFCLRGGRARVTGIGEVVEPLPFEPRTFTLLTPPFGCSTAAVYRAWDDLGGPTAAGPNDLEPAALVVAPDLARWRDALGEVTGRSPALAGSGSTWFVEGSFPGDGRTVVSTVPTYG